MNDNAEEFYFANQPEITYCSLCNNKYDANLQNKKSEIYLIMQERHICFQCAYWLDKIMNKPIGHEIIGGAMYIVNPYVHRPLNVIKGGLGKEFYIRKFDGTIIRTNDLWNVGKIPDRFQNQLPNTANFLSLMTYQKFCKYPHKCNAKGCWDRYHCVRYDLNNEKDGPFNQIPSFHKTGDEHCPSFINFNELKI